MRSGDFKSRFSDHTKLVDHPVDRIWYAIVLVVLVTLPFYASLYQIGLATIVLYTLIAALGLNVLTGFTGLISLGQTGFIMLGAYAYAIGTTRLGLHPGLAFILSGIVPAIAGLIVGIPSLRLKGLYLAITTLAFSYIVASLINFGGDFTGGARGIFVDRPVILGVDFGEDRVLYWFSLAVAILTLIAVLNIRRSRMGRAFMAIRDNDTAAVSMGISLVGYKLLAFTISSFIAGIAGAIMVNFIFFANVEGFPFLLSIEAVAILIVGGLGSVLGVVLGTLFIMLLPEVSTALLKSASSITGWEVSTAAMEIKGIIYGVAIIAFVLIDPRGLVGIWTDIKRLWVNRPLRF